MADVVALSTPAVFVLAMALCLRGLGVKPVIWASAALAPIHVVLSSPDYDRQAVFAGVVLVTALIAGFLFLTSRWPKIVIPVVAAIGLAAALRATIFAPPGFQGVLFSVNYDLSLAYPFQEDACATCYTFDWSSGLQYTNGEFPPQSAWIVLALAVGLLVGAYRKRVAGSRFLQSLATLVLLSALSLFIAATYGRVAPLPDYLRAIIRLEPYSGGGPVLLFWPFLAVAGFYLGERIAASAMAARAPRPQFLTVGAAL